MAFDIPQTYKEGMEEIVIWANALDLDVSKRFMLDVYKIYVDWKYLLESNPIEDINANN